LQIEISFTLYVQFWRINLHLLCIQQLSRDYHRIPQGSQLLITDRHSISQILVYSKLNNSLKDKLHTLTFKYFEAFSFFDSREPLQQFEVLRRNHSFTSLDQHPKCFNLFFYLCFSLLAFLRQLDSLVKILGSLKIIIKRELLVQSSNWPWDSRTSPFWHSSQRSLVKMLHLRINVSNQGY
jgi:hypothetical protein